MLHSDTKKDGSAWMTYENLSNWFYSWKSCLKIHNYIDSIIGDLNQSAPLGNSKNKMLDLIIGKYNYLCNIKVQGKEAGDDVEATASDAESKIINEEPQNNTFFF